MARKQSTQTKHPKTPKDSEGKSSSQVRRQSAAQNRAEQRKDPDQKPLIEASTKRDIAGVAFFIAAVVLLVAAFIPEQGVVSEFLSNLLRLTFGVGVYIIPFFLAAIGATFIIRFQRERVPLRAAIGFGIIFIAILGLIALSTPLETSDPNVLFNRRVVTTRGGYIGAAFAWCGFKLFGPIITAIILVGIIIIGILIIGFSISALVELIRQKRLAREKALSVAPAQPFGRIRRSAGSAVEAVSDIDLDAILAATPAGQETVTRKLGSYTPKPDPVADTSFEYHNAMMRELGYIVDEPSPAPATQEPSEGGYERATYDGYGAEQFPATHEADGYEEPYDDRVVHLEEHPIISALDTIALGKQSLTASMAAYEEALAEMSQNEERTYYPLVTSSLNPHDPNSASFEDPYADSYDSPYPAPYDDPYARASGYSADGLWNSSEVADETQDELQNNLYEAPYGFNPSGFNSPWQPQPAAAPYGESYAQNNGGEFDEAAAGGFTEYADGHLNNSSSLESVIKNLSESYNEDKSDSPVYEDDQVVEYIDGEYETLYEDDGAYEDDNQYEAAYENDGQYEDDDIFEEPVRGKHAAPQKTMKENPVPEPSAKPQLELKKQSKPQPAKMPQAKQDTGFKLPPLDLLVHGDGQTAGASEMELEETASALQETLEDFGIMAKVAGWVAGPTVTLFKVELPPGVRVSRITNLNDDIALALAAPGVRIFAPIPGTNYVGIEVPNKARKTVYLTDVLKDAGDGPMEICIGKDVEGNSIVSDLAKMPHLLIAGTTGSGKSVEINGMIMSILMRATPEQVRFIMIDPKRVEFSGYNGIPHLYVPVVTECKDAAGALSWGVAEMERRLKLFSKVGVRNIISFNEKGKEAKALEEEVLARGEEPPENPYGECVPYIVIVIDELADLMMNVGKEVEASISRIAQLARAAGIHLIIATQRPSTNVVTGLIKANITCRIGLTVASGIDSRVILDSTGAENLCGYGDLLIAKPEYPKPLRVQGPYVSDDEINGVVEYLKSQGEPEYHTEILKTNVVSLGDSSPSGDGGSEALDPLVWDAADAVISSGMASTSGVQRRLKVGYARAGRIMDQLESLGVVGPPNGSKPREILVDEMELETLKAFEMNDE